MNVLFYLAALLAVFSTLMVITRAKAVHALLYLVVSLLALALVFYVLGAPFIAALEVIIYAGAIMVLFLFAVMLLNLGPAADRQEKEWLRWKAWVGPALVSLALLVELVVVVSRGGIPAAAPAAMTPKQVGVSLFGPYLLGVELASMLLLAGLVAAHRLTREDVPRSPADSAGANASAVSAGAATHDPLRADVGVESSSQPTVGGGAGSSGADSGPVRSRGAGAGTSGANAATSSAEGGD